MKWSKVRNPPSWQSLSPSRGQMDGKQTRPSLQQGERLARRILLHRRESQNPYQSTTTHHTALNQTSAGLICGLMRLLNSSSNKPLLRCMELADSFLCLLVFSRRATPVRNCRSTLNTRECPPACRKLRASPPICGCPRIS